MPRVEVLTEVPGRDPETLLTEHVPSEMRANEHYAAIQRQASIGRSGPHELVRHPPDRSER